MPRRNRNAGLRPMRRRPLPKRLRPHIVVDVRVRARDPDDFRPGVVVAVAEWRPPGATERSGRS